MTTSDRLRAAAAKLCEVAEGASAGPWERQDHHVFAAEPAHSRPSVANTSWGDRHKAGPNATYIATLDPPVALALATLLDEVTLFAERYQNGSMARCAVAVADAVLADEVEQVGA